MFHPSHKRKRRFAVHDMDIAPPAPADLDPFITYVYDVLGNVVTGTAVADRARKNDFDFDKMDVDLEPENNYSDPLHDPIIEWAPDPERDNLDDLHWDPPPLDLHPKDHGNPLPDDYNDPEDEVSNLLTNTENEVEN